LLHPWTAVCGCFAQHLATRRCLSWYAELCLERLQQHAEPQQLHKHKVTSTCTVHFCSSSSSGGRTLQLPAVASTAAAGSPRRQQHLFQQQRGSIVTVVGELHRGSDGKLVLRPLQGIEVRGGSVRSAPTVAAAGAAVSGEVPRPIEQLSGDGFCDSSTGSGSGYATTSRLAVISCRAVFFSCCLPCSCNVDTHGLRHGRIQPDAALWFKAERSRAVAARDLSVQRQILSSSAVKQLN
jgi:hypothetical protein